MAMNDYLSDELARTERELVRIDSYGPATTKAQKNYRDQIAHRITDIKRTMAMMAEAPSPMQALEDGKQVCNECGDPFYVIDPTAVDPMNPLCGVCRPTPYEDEDIRAAIEEESGGPLEPGGGLFSAYSPRAVNDRRANGYRG